MLELCQIRSVTQDDLPMLLRWRNHPSIRRFMFTQHEISIEEHLNWFAKAGQDPRRHLLIVEESHRPIGYVQFNNVTAGGISHWGFYACPDAPKGSGKKLGSVSLNHAFSELKLYKVCGQAIDINEASQAFHQSLGFKQEGVLRDQHCLDGTYHSLICFGLLAHEWQAFTHEKEHTHVNH
jgi:UDP-4-amino-4,6-dideoxy-N-acetyl-beta-L-altrosamine N-acetyltransferase